MSADESADESPAPAKPYASWSSLGFGLVAMGLALWVLLRGDPIANIMEGTAADDPFIIAALVHGILGTLAGIVALARREPRRLVLIGLTVSLAAVLAKFVLVALVVAIVLVLVLGMLGALG